METGHLEVKTHKRSLGHSVAAAFAYRGGLAMKNPLTGDVHDYKKRARFGDVLASGIVGARPSALAQSHQVLAEAMELREGRWDSWICRDIEIAHGEGQDQEACEEETEKFALKLVTEHDTIAAWFLHEAGIGDQRGRHGHIIMATRTLSADGNELDQKITVLDNPRTSGRQIAWMRNEWGKDCTAALKRSGQPDATVRMGKRLDAAPDITLGQDVTAMERKAAIAAGFDIKGMSIRELLSTVDPVTERGKDAKEIIVSRDDSDPQYAPYSRSNVDRWIEKKVRARDPLLAEVLDEWTGQIPSVVEEIQTAKQQREAEAEREPNDDESVAADEDARAQDVDEQTHEPGPVADVTKAPKDDTERPKRERQSRGRMSREERRARREERGRGKGRRRRQSRGSEEPAGTAAPLAPEPHAVAARVRDEGRTKPDSPDLGSDASAVRTPGTGLPIAEPTPVALDEGATLDDVDSHRIENEWQAAALDTLEPPDQTGTSASRDDERPALDDEEHRLEAGQYDEALHRLEPETLNEEPPYRASVWDLAEWQDDAARRIDNGEIEIEYELDTRPQFDPDEHADTTAAQIDAGEHDTTTRAPTLPPFEPVYPDLEDEIADAGVDEPRIEEAPTFDPDEHKDLESIRVDSGTGEPESGPTPPSSHPDFGNQDPQDITAQSVDAGEATPDSETTQPEFGHEDHDDSTAALVDSGEHATGDAGTPLLPDIDRDQIEDKAVQLIHGMLARIAEEADDGVDRTPDEETRWRMEESVQRHLYGTQYHLSLADELHAASRRRIEGARESEHELIARWSPDASRHAPFTSHRMATTAARRITDYWEPRGGTGQRRRRRKSLVGWIADSVVVIGTIIALAVVTEIEDWRRDRELERARSRTKFRDPSRGPGAG